MYVYVYIYIYAYIYTYVHTCIYTSTYTFVRHDRLDVYTHRHGHSVHVNVYNSKKKIIYTNRQGKNKICCVSIIYMYVHQSSSSGAAGRAPHKESHAASTALGLEVRGCGAPSSYTSPSSVPVYMGEGVCVCVRVCARGRGSE